MPNFIFAGLSVVSGAIKQELIAASYGSLSSSGPWRPSEWAQPALTAITAPLIGTSSPGTDQFGTALPGAPAYDGGGTQIYVFDAVFKADHARDLKTTDSPIQTSQSSPVQHVTDHAYRVPARVTLEIGMSDAMDSYQSGMWSGNASKSVSAFHTLVSLQQARTLVTLTTRLDTYQNMLVESIRPSDTAKTLHGLRATVVFKEIFLASIAATPVAFWFSLDDAQAALSARQQTTDITNLGTVQPQPVPAALTEQHNITAVLAPSGSMLAPAPYHAVPGLDYDIPGAGSWSSGGLGGASGGPY